jgi:molybdopterin-guanine dinucleotide biosynthesis protein A
MMSEPISVAILAGGLSSRMGRNKAFIEVGGQPMIERVIARVRGLADELLLIANTPDEYAHLGLPIHPDLIPGMGALGGLYTAIAQAGRDHVLVVSCDQPLLNSDLLAYLVGLRHGYDVVVPLNREGLPESIHAVYGKVCLGPIRRRLEAGRLKVVGFYSDVRVREVPSSETDRFDLDRRSFMNVNTPGDLAEARRLAVQLDGS